jgi:hypothetical protein
MDGVIVKYDPKSATGIIRSDGKMYQFKRAGWQERRAPRIDDKVEFEAENDSATQIYHMAEKDRLPTAAEKIAASFDLGLIAGGYAIVFFLAAIVDSFINVIGLDANDMIGLFVILDLLTLAAWMRSTNYRIMRIVATVFAAAVTGLAVLILVRHTLQGGA